MDLVLFLFIFFLLPAILLFLFILLHLLQLFLPPLSPSYHCYPSSFSPQLFSSLSSFLLLLLHLMDHVLLLLFLLSSSFSFLLTHLFFLFLPSNHATPSAPPRLLFSRSSPFSSRCFFFSCSSSSWPSYSSSSLRASVPPGPDYL